MDIYVMKDGEQLGPYSREQAFARLRDGSLTSGDLAWTEGMADWETLEQVLARGKLKFAVAREPEPQEPIVARRTVANPAPKPFRKAKNTAGGGWVVKGVGLAAVVGAAIYAFLYVEAVKEWVSRFSGKAAPEIAEPDQTDAAPAAQVPPPVEAGPRPPTEPVEEIDLNDFAKTPNRWPKQVKLTKPTEFPIIINGSVKGSVTLPAGANVRVVRIMGLTLEVENAGARKVIGASSTNLREIVRQMSM